MMDQRNVKRLSRRDFLRASVAVAAFSTLAACAPAPTGQTGAAEQTAAEEPAAEEPAAEEPAAVEPAPEPTVAIGEYGDAAEAVVLWHGLGGADGATFAQMLESYATSGEGTGVRSETYGWDVFFQKYPTSVAAGTPPDFAIYHAAEVPQMADLGIMLPLDDVFFNTGLLPKDDFGQVMIDAVTVGGETMAIPFDNHGWGLYYNTKIIEDAGLDPENLPKDGAEFIDWAKQVTVDVNGNHPDDSGFDPDNVKVWAIHDSWHRFTMPSTMFQFGGGTVSEDQTTALLDSPESMAAIQYWYDLMHVHHVCPPVVPGRLGSYDMYRPFSLALMWDGSWSLNFFNDNPDVAAVTKARGLNSLAPDGHESVKMDAHIMSIPPGVSEAGMERATKLIKWLSDNGKTWATSGQVPARLSVQNDPDVQGIWSVKAYAEEFNAFGKTEVPHKAFIEIQTAWEAAVSAALTQTTPLEQALQEGSATIQAILDRP